MCSGDETYYLLRMRRDAKASPRDAVTTWKVRGKEEYNWADSVVGLMYLLGAAE